MYIPLLLLLLFVSLGTGSFVQISWLARHKDELRGKTFLTHRYQPFANGFSVLLDADIRGSIWEKGRLEQENLISPIFFQIGQVINVSGMALTQKEIDTSPTGKRVDWTAQNSPNGHASDVFSSPHNNITLTNNTLLLKVEFMPTGLTFASQPWELMLMFQVEGWCDFSWWSHFKTCNTSFGLIAYGLNAQLKGDDADGDINGTYVWTSIWSKNIWNSTDENGTKSDGFICDEIHLQMQHPNSTTQAELLFKNLKMSVFLDLDTARTRFPLFHWVNMCSSNTPHSSWIMKWLIYNWTMLLLYLILVAVGVAILYKIYESRQRRSTRYNIAAVNSPFSLDDFDDVDVWIPFEHGNKRKKNLPKMIH